MSSTPRTLLYQLILVTVWNTIIFADDCVSKQEYELMNARFQGLASKFDDTIQDLKSRLARAEDSAAEMKLNWQDSDRKWQVARDQVDRLMKNWNLTDEHSVSKRQLQTTTQGAFYARLSRSVSVNNGQTIIFDQEYTDMSSAYHETNGVYMAPATGVYVFSWTIGVKHHWIISELVVEGSQRGYSLADLSGDDSDYGSATQLVVIKITKGQNVWIRKVEGSGVIDGFRFPHDTTFSGWMLYP